MINPNAAWTRLQHVPMFRGMKLKDFRPIVFGQQFDAVAANAVVGPIRRDFPGGAIILGVTGSCIQDAQAFAAGSTGSRNSFAADFAYTNDEQIAPGGPIMGQALIGTAEECQFPPREIIVAPTQGINTRVENLTTSVITVHIAFHCLVWRFAS